MPLSALDCAKMERSLFIGAEKQGGKWFKDRLTDRQYTPAFTVEEVWSLRRQNLERSEKSESVGTTNRNPVVDGFKSLFCDESRPGTPTLCSVRKITWDTFSSSPIGPSHKKFN